MSTLQLMWSTQSVTSKCALCLRYKEKPTLSVITNNIMQLCLIQSSRYQGVLRHKDLRDTYYGRTNVKVSLCIIIKVFICRQKTKE